MTKKPNNIPNKGTVTKMKFKKHVSLVLAALTLASSALIGCGEEESPYNDFDPTAPGDEYSGSISKEDENTETKPEEPKDEGDPDKTYYISNADELMAMKRKGTYVLTADIDLTGKKWTPVGTYESPFVGKLDGAGYTIKGLTVTEAKEDTGDCLSYTYSYAGLIGFAEGATITNVKLESVNINVYSNVKNRVLFAGSVAGMVKDTVVNNCTVVSGSIKTSSPFFKAYSAGISAFSFEGTFSNCSVNATVEASDSKVRSVAGGIVAHAGDNTKTVCCSVAGTVTSVSTDGNSYSGGINGYLSNSVISHGTVTAAVKSESKCSAAETGKAGAAYAGGIAAYATTPGETTCKVSVAAARGSVTAVSADYVSYAGGIFAYAIRTELTEAYSTSSVTATSNSRDVFAGGMAGYISTENKFNGIFFAGSITARSSLSTVRTGVITAYFASEDAENKSLIEKAGRLPTSELSVSVNGKKYNVGDKLPENEFYLSHGDEYSKGELRSSATLKDALGWSANNWSFSLSDYPILNYSGYQADSENT